MFPLKKMNLLNVAHCSCKTWHPDADAQHDNFLNLASIFKHLRWELSNVSFSIKYISLFIRAIRLRNLKKSVEFRH